MSKYNERTVTRITDLLRSDSYTIPEICRLSGISESTYHTWKSTKPEFSEAVSRARKQFDDILVTEATRSLLKLVKGFSYTESRKVYSNRSLTDSEGEKILQFKEIVTSEKYVGPSVNAIIFVLCNLDSDNWKNIFRIEITGKNDPRSARVLSKKEANSIEFRMSKKSDQELNDILKKITKHPV